MISHSSKRILNRSRYAGNSITSGFQLLRIFVYPGNFRKIENCLLPKYGFLSVTVFDIGLLRVSEANEVPISSRIWVGLSTFNWL